MIDDYKITEKNKTRYQLIIKFLIYIILDIRSNLIYIILIISRYAYNFIKLY